MVVNGIALFDLGMGSRVFHILNRFSATDLRATLSDAYLEVLHLFFGLFINSVYKYVIDFSIFILYPATFLINFLVPADFPGMYSFLHKWDIIHE